MEKPIEARKKKKIRTIKPAWFWFLVVGFFGFFFSATNKTEEYQDAALPARGAQDLATWIVPGQGLLLH